MPPFHLAFPVHNIAETRAFYNGLLGCPIGREAERWIDFDFFGHQISAHLAELSENETCNPVDGESVPVRHFGVILEMAEWKALRNKLQATETEFLISPQIRFEGQVGEQATFFIRDPSGNALEFKAFADKKLIFSQ